MNPRVVGALWAWLASIMPIGPVLMGAGTWLYWTGHLDHAGLGELIAVGLPCFIGGVVGRYCPAPSRRS